MPTLNRMSAVVADRPVRTPCERGRAGFAAGELDLSDTAAKRAQRTDERRDAIRWAFTVRIAPYFDRACEVYCRDLDAKASTLAEEMGVGASVLSEMRKAARLIGAEHLEVLRAHRPARLILASADRETPAMTFAMLRDRIVEIIIEDAKRGGLIGEKVLDEAARREGVDREDVDAVIERGEAADERPAGSSDA